MNSNADNWIPTNNNLSIRIVSTVYIPLLPLDIPPLANFRNRRPSRQFEIFKTIL
jgi:hypothetical protein